MQQAPPPEPDDEGRSRSNLVVVLVAVVLVIAGIWLVNKLIDMSNLENCVESGRRNCAPIDTRAR